MEPTMLEQERVTFPISFQSKGYIRTKVDGIANGTQYLDTI